MSLFPCHHHPLVLKYNSGDWICNVCRGPKTATMASHRCDTCDFDVCFLCKDKQAAMAPVAVMQQPPQVCYQQPPPQVYYQQPPPQVYYQQPPPQVYQPAPAVRGHPHSLAACMKPSPWICNECREMQRNPSQPSRRCEMCDYDVCGSCFAKFGTTVVTPPVAVVIQPQVQVQVHQGHHHPHHGAAAAAAVASMQRLTLYATCHEHPLLKTVNSTSWTCNNCRTMYNAQPRFRCYACDYDLCERCSNTVIMTGIHQHALYHCPVNTGVQKICNNCRKMTTQIAYTCAPCDFDLCASCFASSQPGYFYIVHSSGLVLDAEGGRSADRTALILWPKKSAADSVNQLWRFDGKVLRSCMAGGPTVDVSGGKPTPGSQVHLFHYHGKPNQQWTLDGPFLRSEMGYNLVMSAAGSSGAHVYATHATGALDQFWHLETA